MPNETFFSQCDVNDKYARDHMGGDGLEQNEGDVGLESKCGDGLEENEEGDEKIDKGGENNVSEIEGSVLENSFIDTRDDEDDSLDSDYDDWMDDVGLDGFDDLDMDEYRQNVEPKIVAELC